MSLTKIAETPPETSDRPVPTTATAPVATVLIQPQKGWKVIDWRELVEYRDLLYFMVLREVTVIYKQTILGFTWAIINPFFSMVVFSVIFGRFGKMPSDGIPYPIFSYTALLPWTYFAGALTGSTNSLIQGTALFTKVYFPRLFIPMVPILSKLVDFAIAFVVLAGMMVWYHVMPSLTILYLPVLILLMVLTAAGMGMWLSALAIQFRDVKHAMGFIVQILMYAAPVIYPVSMIPAKYRLFYGIYPMAGVIEGFRAAILGSRPMPWDLIAVGGATSAILFISGAFYFRRLERIFADVA